MRTILMLILALFAMAAPALAETTASEVNTALIQNDAVIAGILLAMLALIFWTSNHGGPLWQKFYTVLPMLLLCYFLPSLLTAFGLVDPEHSKVYHVCSRYLLPASLVLLTISIDLREVFKLGSKAVIMFLTGTIGVVIGGPLAIWVTSFFSPELVGGQGPEEVWRGLATVAGSWIGGGANQAAMNEIFEPSAELYAIMVTVDVIVAEAWMMLLLLGVGRASKIDAWTGADASSITRLKESMETFSKKTAKIATSTDLMVVLGVAFGATALAHAAADFLGPSFLVWYPEMAQRLSLGSSFFWLVVIATTIGIALSFTKARNLEGVGASKIGTVFIFMLVASIGLKMDITAVLKHPGLFAVGGLWMLIHVTLLTVVGYFIKAPYFFLAVGSKANIGGAASAPVVAAAFHPSLAPVGVLLAVLGYALGTYGAWLCAILMKGVAPALLVTL